MIAVPVFSTAPSSFHDLRLDGHIRAVVGSSAMRIFGLQAMAMAIIARCRIPPLNSWGY